MKTKAAALAATALCALVSTASASNITVRRSDNVLNVVDIRGDITNGDSDTFKQVTSGLTGTTLVVLNSDGGKVYEGLRMATVIHGRHYETAIPNDAVCASICGIMWLSGSVRHISATGEVGFHAASRNGSESGQGSALIGAFLGRIGMSYNVVAYVTEAPPDEINWLTEDKANELGITLTIHPIKLAEATPSPPPPAAPPVAPSVAGTSADPALASFAEGRKQRQEWETWINGLPMESFRIGAEWWASHRSDKPAPSCVTPTNPEWTKGCMSAQHLLSHSDVMRRADASFKAGWNSL